MRKKLIVQLVFLLFVLKGIWIDSAYCGIPLLPRPCLTKKARGHFNSAPPSRLSHPNCLDYEFGQIASCTSYRSTRQAYEKIARMAENESLLLRKGQDHFFQVCDRLFKEHVKIDSLIENNKFLKEKTSCGLTAHAISGVLQSHYKLFSTKQTMEPFEAFRWMSEEAGPAIFTIHLNSGKFDDGRSFPGHALVLEKTAEGGFRLYQSFVGEYSLNDFLSADCFPYKDGFTFDLESIADLMVKFQSVLDLILSRAPWTEEIIENYRIIAMLPEVPDYEGLILEVVEEVPIFLVVKAS